MGGFGEIKQVVGRTVHDDFGGGLMGKLWNVLASESCFKSGAVVKVFLHKSFSFLFVFFDFFEEVRLAEGEC